MLRLHWPRVSSRSDKAKLIRELRYETGLPLCIKTAVITNTDVEIDKSSRVIANIHDVFTISRAVLVMSRGMLIKIGP